MEALLPEPDGKPKRLQKMHMRAPEIAEPRSQFILLFWRH
jgi:hypothetical protein